MDEKKEKVTVTQSCPTLCDAMDYSLPGSSVHGIFQARVLEWGAIAFSVIAIWAWANLLTFPSVSFSICEMGW